MTPPLAARIKKNKTQRSSAAVLRPEYFFFFRGGGGGGGSRKNGVKRTKERFFPFFFFLWFFFEHHRGRFPLPLSSSSFFPLFLIRAQPEPSSGIHTKTKSEKRPFQEARSCLKNLGAPWVPREESLLSPPRIFVVIVVDDLRSTPQHASSLTERTFTPRSIELADDSALSLACSHALGNRRRGKDEKRRGEKRE